MAASDYQAFIMLNSSNNVKQPQNLQPLTSIVNNDTQTKHKISDSILPVCNRPMIHYVLDWCEQAFFSEVNLVIYDENASNHVIEFSELSNNANSIKGTKATITDDIVESYEVSKLKQIIQPFIDMRWKMYKATLKDHSLKTDDNSNAYNVSVDKDIVGNLVPNNQVAIKEPIRINIITTKYKNEGEVLMKTLANRIKDKFVLLPSDFITDLPPQILSHQFFQFSKFNKSKQLKKSNDESNVGYYDDEDEIKSDKNSFDEDLETTEDIIMMSCFYKSQLSQVEKKKSNVNDYILYQQLDRSTPYANILLDSYTQENIEKQKYLKIREALLWKFTNIKGSKLLLDSGIYYCNQKVLEIIENINKNQVDFIHRPLKKIFRDLSRRSWVHAKLKERIAMFVLPEVVKFAQINSMVSYLETSRQMLNLIQENDPKMLDKLDHTVNVLNDSQQTGISQQSQIGEKTVLMAQSNVKKSLIGYNCKIGKKVKITGSIILDNAEIEDNCIIENCIIGYDTIIKKKSKMVNCQVEGGFVIPESSMFKGEQLKRDDLDDLDDAYDVQDEDKSLLEDDENVVDDDDSDSDSEETGDENDYYDEELEDAGDFQFGF